MDDISGLDDPASIGWTILGILTLFIVYSAYFYSWSWLRYTEISDRIWIQRLQRYQSLHELFPALCLLGIGMLGLKLVHIVQIQLLKLEIQLPTALFIVGLIMLMLAVMLLERMVRKKLMASWKLVMSNHSNGEEAIDVATAQSQSFNADRIFGEKTAREVMTPRLDMICLDRSRSFQHNIDTAVLEMRTRYPVVDKDKDDIIGFIHIKDLLAMYDDKDARLQWQCVIRPIITVPDSINISLLLSMMQKQKTQIALLIDEYGGTSGMVTMEDIIEEVIGDIQDEFDQEEVSIVKLQGEEYRVSAMLLIEEVNSYFSIYLEADEMDSIGGFMYANIQFPPHVGQSVVYEQNEQRYIFAIDKMEQLRIISVKVTRRELTAYEPESSFL